MIIAGIAGSGNLTSRCTIAGFDALSGHPDTCQMPDSPTRVTRNAVLNRFEIAGEPSAFLHYARAGDHIRLIHTEVPEAFRGHGYAATLARAALEYARDEHLRVIPVCPFVRGYLARHPEFVILTAEKAPPTDHD